MITYNTLNLAAFFTSFVTHLYHYVYHDYDDSRAIDVTVEYCNKFGAGYINISFENTSISVYAYRHNELGEKIEYLKDIENATKDDITELIKWAGL